MPKIQVLPRHVAELNDPSVAAIASAETAGLYGLQILSAGINADGDNTTRFIVIERAAAAPAMTGEGQRHAISPASWPQRWIRSVRGALTWSASRAVPCPMFRLNTISMYRSSARRAARARGARPCWTP